MYKNRENLDLREETVVAARPEEPIHSIIGSIGWIVVMAGGAADGRTTAGDVGAAVAHGIFGVEVSESRLTSVYPSTSAGDRKQTENSKEENMKRDGTNKSKHLRNSDTEYPHYLICNLANYDYDFLFFFFVDPSLLVAVYSSKRNAFYPLPAIR